MSLTHNPKIKTGIVGGHNGYAKLCTIAFDCRNNLSPRSHADLASVQHRGVVSEGFTRIECAHHFGGVGEVLKHKPIALTKHVAALVANGIAHIINVTLKADRFSVQNQKNVFHYAALLLS